MKRVARGLCGLAVLLAVAGAADAQPYPSRTIEIVVSYGAELGIKLD